MTTKKTTKKTSKKTATKSTKPATAKASKGQGRGTAEDPWLLKTPPLSSDFTAWRDETADPPALVVQVGKTQLRYHLGCIDDLHAMLVAHDDWMPLGSADEQKPRIHFHGLPLSLVVDERMVSLRRMQDCFRRGAQPTHPAR